MIQKEWIFILSGIVLCIIMLVIGLIGSGEISSHNEKDTLQVLANIESTVTQTAPIYTTTATTTKIVTTTTRQTLSSEEKQKRREQYVKEITVVGDSIAYGFNAYGFISDEQNLAQGSVAIRNIHEFTFCYGEEAYDIMDALELAQPAYIYMSMGMNDVNMTTSEEYGVSYEAAIREILKRCPNSNLIIAGITPVTLESEFTDNANIREFNRVLKAVVAKINVPQLQYFDAYAVIADIETQDMRPECSSGDGIHLSGESYKILLEAVYDVLDTMPEPKKLLYSSKNETETTTETEDTLLTDEQSEAETDKLSEAE